MNPARAVETLIAFALLAAIAINAKAIAAAIPQLF